MKPNPFVLPMLVGGGILSLLGVLFTIVSVVGTAGQATPIFLTIAPLMLAVGVPFLVGGVVLAGVDWRARNGRLTQVANDHLLVSRDDPDAAADR